MAGKRVSLFEAFPDLNISGEQQSSSRPDSKPSFRGSLSKSLSSKWPTWSSIKVPHKPVSFTIRISQHLKTLATSQGHDPRAVEQSVQQVSSLASGGFSADRNEAVYMLLENDMISAIFGSNFISKVGATYDVTVKLCRDILRGNEVPELVDNRDPEYAVQLKALAVQAGLANAGKAEVLRSRQEIIQHARAFNHLTEAFCFGHQSMSEDLIKATHIILVDGMLEDGKPGEYRGFPIAAQYPGQKKPTEFIRWQTVPGYMAKLVSDFEGSVTKAENGATLDPYDLAAHFSHHFINIHPFADGNGRMSRMFLNAILLKYAGHVVAFGENGDSDREEYLGITMRASKEFRKEDQEEPEPKGHTELGVLALKRSQSGLRRLLEKLKK